MRNFTPKGIDASDGYTSGIRSDFNGPVIWNNIDGFHKPSNTTRNMRYKAVKPYDHIVSGVLRPFPLINMDPLPPLPDVKDLLFEEFEDLTHHPFLISSVDFEYAINGAIESSQAYGEVLLFVTASEAKQTVRMVRSVFIRVFNIVLDIMSSVKKLNVVATADIIANIWLEYRYGWRPLIGEIQAIHKALTVVRPDGIKSAFGLNLSDKEPTYHFSKKDVGSYDSFVSYSIDMVGLPGSTVKTGFNYTNTEDSRNDDWFAVFGVDWASLASTAWELVPFSFILDMFVNVGNSLQARDFASQVSSFNGYSTIISKSEVQVNVDEVVVRQPLTIFDVFPSQFLAVEVGPLTDPRLNPIPLVTSYYHYWLLALSSGFDHESAFTDSEIGGSSFLPDLHGPVDDVPNWNFFLDNHFSKHLDDSLSEYLSANSLPRRSFTKGWDYRLVTDVHGTFSGFSRRPDLYEPLIRPDGSTLSLDDFHLEALGYFYQALWDTHSVSSTSGMYTKYSPERSVPFSESLRRIHCSILSDHDLNLTPLADLYSRSKVKTLQRRPKSEFNHTYTGDTDISSAQFADLSAFAVKMAAFLSK